MQTLTTPMIPMQTPLELCQKTYQPTWICPVPPSNDESHEDEMGGPSAAVTPLPADGGEVPREAGGNQSLTDCSGPASSDDDFRRRRRLRRSDGITKAKDILWENPMKLLSKSAKRSKPALRLVSTV